MIKIKRHKKRKRHPIIGILIFLLTLCSLMGTFWLISGDLFSVEQWVICYGNKLDQFTDQNIDEILSGIDGRIPILMYHNIITPKSGKKLKDIPAGQQRYFITSEQLRLQLETLHQANFRNISLDEYLSLMKGKQKFLDRVPPNSKLYVLTFDDATLGQFNLIKDKKGDLIIDPDCAVGIMLEFARKYPDFKLNAAFCIDWENVPFGQTEYIEKKLNMLLDYGFEIINHTASHSNLTNFLPDHPEMLEYEIGKAMELFESYLGYRVRAIDKLAYPGGFENPEIYEYVKTITYNDKTYHFIAALDAEDSQAYNPNDQKFNPYDISRIEVTPHAFQKFIIKAKGLFNTPQLKQVKETNRKFDIDSFDFSNSIVEPIID